MVHGIPTRRVASHVWYISKARIGGNYEFVSLFCFTLFFYFATCSHNEAGEGIETNKGTQFSQDNSGRYADFNRIVRQRIHLVHSVSVIRARSNYTTVFMGEDGWEHPLTTTGGNQYRFRSIRRTQVSTWELYKCYLRKTTYSTHQPSSAIDFMISYEGSRSERLTDIFGSTRNTYWEYRGISPHNIELRKQSITTSFYSLALAIFRRDCYFDSHVTFTARLSISEFKLHKT